MLPDHTDVLIVGAGPTGLALAIALRQAGIDHLIIDKLEGGQNTSRAAVIHAHTLEAIEPLGVSEALMRRGLPITRFAIRDRDRTLLQLGFDALPSAYRCLLMIPQDVTEAVLGDRLTALGGSVHRGHAALSVTQRPDAATAQIVSSRGSRAVTARYVVGADGMHSIVRESAGIAFKGSTYEESFVLADVKMDWPLGTGEVTQFFSPAGLVVVAPLPGGSFRVVATLDQAPERPAKADIQQLIDTRGPAGPRTEVREVTWSSRFRLHHRVVDTYRNGRLLLMGDAAHVHSPAGGQGMNTGLVDSVVLGQSLVRILADGQPDAVLDAYGALRRQAAVEVLRLAGRLTGIATMRSGPQRMLRNGLLHVFGALPPARQKLIMNLSGLSRKALAKAA